DRAIASVQVIHREVDAVEAAPFDGQVARDARADRDHRRIEARELCGVLDLDAVAELDSLVLELLEAPVDDGLLDLEVGDAEAHQAAAGLVALEDGDEM